MFISTAPRTLESVVNGEDRIHDAKQALGQVVLHGSVAEITAATSAVGHLMSLSPAETQHKRSPALRSRPSRRPKSPTEKQNQRAILN